MTRLVAVSLLEPTTDGTATVPLPVAAIATPPATSAATTTNATTNGTSRRDPGACVRRRGAGASSSGASSGASWSKSGVETTDLRGIDHTGVGAEPGERERLRRREGARGIGERRAHGRGVGVALRRIRTAGAFHHRPEPAELCRREQRRVLTCREGSDRGVGHRGHGARDGFGEHHRERVEVGAAVEWRAAGLLGRGIPRGADHRTRGFRPTRFRERARETEVGDAHDPVLVEQEVGGFDVAVDDPSHVRVLERGRDLPSDVDGLRRGESLAGVEQASEASASQELEHHERHVVVAPVVHRHHVRVVQRGRDLRLGAEPPQETGVVREGEVEHLHRDAAAEPNVVGHVDATARARADRREQAVPAGEDSAGEIGDATDRHSVQRTGRHDAERGTPGRYPRPMADAKRARVFEHPGRVAVIVIALIAVLNLGYFLLARHRHEHGRQPS